MALSPSREARARKTNLPARKRSFVGRDDELRAIERAFADEHRLVTLWGTAGIGKTELALRYAASDRALRDEGSGGVWFCDLSDARTAADVCALVARVLEVPLAPRAALEQHIAQLENVIAAQEDLLLVLDNFEQLVACAPDTIVRWLAASYDARVLVTSRERLRVEDELYIEVPALALPPRESSTPAIIERSEAGALFVARARSVRADFHCNTHVADAIASIVHAVEGVPLAIELCAARMGTLGPAELLAQLAQRTLDAPGPAARGVSKRRASLRGAIAWSWDLLEPIEKRALAHCSVFRGGFTLAAAEHALDLPEGDRGGSSTPRALDVLQALVDKSLLRVVDAPLARDDRRFEMLDAIHAFAAEKLAASDDRSDVVRRHASYFLAVASDWAQRVETIDGLECLQRLTEESENLQSVCAHALAEPSPRGLDALYAVMALAPLVLEDAIIAIEPYVALFDAALSATEATRTDAESARALLTRARIEFVRNDYGKSEVLFERSIAAARASNAATWCALALARLATVRTVGGGDGANALIEEAELIAAQLGDPWVEAMVAVDRTNILRRSGREIECGPLYYRAEALFRRVGDRTREGAMQGQLGAYLYDMGRYEEAQRCCERSLTAVRAAGGRRQEGTVMAFLGYIAQARGDLAAARDWHEAALAQHRRQGERWCEVWDIGNLGALAFEANELEQALSHFEHASRLSESLTDATSLIVNQSWQAAIEATLGLVSLASVRFDEVERKTPPSTPPRIRAMLALNRAQLDARLAREADARGEPERASEHRLRARSVIDAMAKPTESDPVPQREQTADVRMCIRLLERALGAEPSSQRSVRAKASVLKVGPEGRWFELVDGSRVELLKHRSLRLLLLALVQRRVAEPGRALTLAQLFSAGWPGERASDSAASNRVYVGLTRLRNMGLRPALQSRDDGIVLDPALSIVHETWAPGEEQ